MGASDWLTPAVLARMRRDRGRFVRRIVQLAGGAPSGHPEALAYRYGRDLARLARVLGPVENRKVSR